MKVAFIARATLYTDSGGDTVQVVNTAGYLRKLGLEVDICLASETINYNSYDLLHFFNIIRPADILHHIIKSGKPYVVSTIFVDYSEYDQQHRKGFTGLLFRFFSSDAIEYLKTVARFMASHQKIVSPEYLWVGHRQSIKKIIKKAGLLLPNSVNEYNRLVKQYAIEHPFRNIPNAISPELFVGHPQPVKDTLMVLQVARIEGRKNQLNLIKALNNTRFKLVIIGHPAANQPEYYNECKKLAAPNISFIPAMPQQELLKYYQQAKVHVLPSWFETTGLSSLEAAVMHCNIVVSDKGDVREYFGDLAFYCDPGSPESILAAVEKAAAAPYDESLRNKILSEYTWEQTAAKTLEAYREVLSGNS
jgi:glycosyltransferase involved in cell wall biosynthesis